MTYQEILAQVGTISAYTAKQMVRELPGFNESMIDEISKKHDEVMNNYEDHHARVTQVNRRGW